MPHRYFIPALFILVACYSATGWLLAYAYDAQDRFSFLLYSRPVVTTSFLLAALFLAAISFKIMVVDRPAHLTQAIFHVLKTRWITPARLKQGVPVVIAFLFFMAAFTSLKSMIPLVNPYGWDQTFMMLDRVVHGGHDPWRLLQPLVGYPLLTFIINFVYNMWFPVMFGVLYWQAFSLSRPALREQFFLTFFLCWIVNGTVLAMLLSSVGPCFYGLLLPGGDNPYESLMTYLHQANEVFPVWALNAQEMLWSYYQQNALGLGAGIAAMPSLHISIAFLQMLMAYRVNRRAGHVFAVFFIIILIGSVHLGWHYALDGYLSILTTLILWIGAGTLLRKYHAET